VAPAPEVMPAAAAAADVAAARNEPENIRRHLATAR
jgi:hypothetical protein